MKLKFGDPKSIAIRDNYVCEKAAEKVIGKVRCPFCKMPADHAYDVDLLNEVIGWNFKCKKNCINHLNNAGDERSQTWTDLNGKSLWL